MDGVENKREQRMDTLRFVLSSMKGDNLPQTRDELKTMDVDEEELPSTMMVLLWWIDLTGGGRTIGGRKYRKSIFMNT